jgi:hypothetical protein
VDYSSKAKSSNVRDPRMHPGCADPLLKNIMARSAIFWRSRCLKKNIFNYNSYFWVNIPYACPRSTAGV